MKNLFRTKHRPTRSQTGARVLLGALMAYAGVSHLSFHRKDFQDQVPSWFPADPDAVVIGSGVAEIGLGAALLGLPRHFRLTGLALAVFYVLIFPGNVAQYVERRDSFGLDTDAKRRARLFGQIPLVAAALWAAGLPERPRR
ncbi:DoxX family membrane protein [Corynebacterium sp. zg-331]|nr:DoxX family membrane protein [Corynebacterium sp. zg-331]MPV52361.1 DoxX family membrane protein [Corynebacterium sp. zg331]